MGLFEFSLCLPLDLKINTTPLKSSQIYRGGGIPTRSAENIAKKLVDLR